MNKKVSLYTFFNKKVLKFYSELEKCIQNPGIDEIHDARVAARKLFTYISGFTQLMYSDILNEYLKSLKRTLGLLGRIRELDICLLLTNEFIKTYNSESIVISNLASQISVERNKKYKRMINNKSFQKVIIERDTLSELININLDNKSISGNDNNIFILEHLKYKIVKYYKKILNPVQSTNSFSKIDIIHSKRITAKGIRYLTELINELFGDILEKQTAKLKNFTDLSGELHDYDVLKGLFNNYLQKLIELKNDNSIYADDYIIKFNNMLNAKTELLITRTEKINRQIESIRFQKSILSAINSLKSNQ